MKILNNIHALSIIALLTISCGSDDDNAMPVRPAPTSDIFALASSNVGGFTHFYYKNDTKINLTTAVGETAYANSLQVFGNDIYVSGYVLTTSGGLNFEQACYWKNNVKVNMSHTIDPNGGNTAEVQRIAISNGNVYAIGNLSPTVGSRSRVVLWTNGVSSFVSPATSLYYNYPTEIAVYNNEVFVSGIGRVRDDTQAKMWKNGVETNLSAFASEASSIVVNETGVHVLFQEYISSTNQPLQHWRDGIVKTINTGLPRMGKMTLRGADVYISGSYRNETSDDKACYWKNGEKTDLDNGNNKIAGTIKFDIHGNIFIAEKPTDVRELTYWTNNTKYTLGLNTDNFKDFDINNK